MKKTLDFYQKLSYWYRTRYEIDESGEEYWIAWVNELPGCEIDSNTRTDAIQRCTELFDDYIKIHLEEGLAIAEPAKRIAPNTTVRISHYRFLPTEPTTKVDKVGPQTAGVHAVLA